MRWFRCFFASMQTSTTKTAWHLISMPTGRGPRSRFTCGGDTCTTSFISSCHTASSASSPSSSSFFSPVDQSDLTSVWLADFNQLARTKCQLIQLITWIYLFHTVIYIRLYSPSNVEKNKNRCFTKHKPHAGCWKSRRISFFLSLVGDFVPSLLTLTFKLVQAKDQTRLPCEFGANPFSGSRDIWHKQNTDWLR